VRQVLSAGGEITGEVAERLQRVARLLDEPQRDRQQQTGVRNGGLPSGGAGPDPSTGPAPTMSG
jgi:hypothetical protein